MKEIVLGFVDDREALFGELDCGLWVACRVELVLWLEIVFMGVHLYWY